MRRKRNLKAAPEPTGPTLQLILRPGNGGQFSAWLADGTAPIASSNAPVLAAARALLERGDVTPDTVLIARHVGAAFDAFRVRASVAAALTVDDAGTHGPYFRRWRPPSFVTAATDLVAVAHDEPLTARKDMQ